VETTKIKKKCSKLRSKYPKRKKKCISYLDMRNMRNNITVLSVKSHERKDSTYPA